MTWRLLNIYVEGQTEDDFVRLAIRPQLEPMGMGVATRQFLTGRKRREVFRGGLVSYAPIRRDLRAWIMEQRSNKNIWFTTMFDFYGLRHRCPDFPGYRETTKTIDPYEKAELLENALADDIAIPLDFPRFIPYVQLHEFEALIFANPHALGSVFPTYEGKLAELEAISAQYPNPEMINEGEMTAPSKRIARVMPVYARRKTAGAQVAAKIGLEPLRARCPRFAAWLTRLEAIAGS